MISVLYKRGAAGAPNACLCGTHSTDPPGVAEKDSCLIQAHTRFTRYTFLLIQVVSLCLSNAANPSSSSCSLFLQRDAQVARREPQKAFGHQPSAQTAQVPGGGRGHQGGPQVLPLSRGHQQRVHRGANTEDHRVLWISALECELQEWVNTQCSWVACCSWHGRAECGRTECEHRLNNCMGENNVHTNLYGQWWKEYRILCVKIVTIECRKTLSAERAIHRSIVIKKYK